MEITRIAQENAGYFLPDEALEDALAENSVALGSITDDGEAVGYIIAEADGNGLMINRIYTAPSQRRKGFTTALLDYVCELAGDSGFAYTAGILFLTDSETETDPAFNLLKKAGFTEEESPSKRKTYDLGSILEKDPFADAKLPKGARYVPADPVTNKYGGAIFIGDEEAAALTCVPFFSSALISELRSDGRSLPLLSYLLQKTTDRMKEDGVATVYVDLAGENIIKFEELFTAKFGIKAASSANAHIMIREAENE